MLGQLEKTDPLLDIARELETAALEDDYFIERKLYPNVDFYSGTLLRAIGIPLEMFTVMFAIGRMPGWIANWKEINDDTKSRIYRPRQVYVGPTGVEWRGARRTLIRIRRRQPSRRRRTASSTIRVAAPMPVPHHAGGQPPAPADRLERRQLPGAHRRPEREQHRSPADHHGPVRIQRLHRGLQRRQVVGVVIWVTDTTVGGGPRQ